MTTTNVVEITMGSDKKVQIPTTNYVNFVCDGKGNWVRIYTKKEVDDMPDEELLLSFIHKERVHVWNYDERLPEIYADKHNTRAEAFVTTKRYAEIFRKDVLERYAVLLK